VSVPCQLCVSGAWRSGFRVFVLGFKVKPKNHSWQLWLQGQRRLALIAIVGCKSQTLLCMSGQACQLPYLCIARCKLCVCVWGEGG
jgi:hypothetical protein